MPELPDVEIFRKYFEPTGLNKPIKEVEMRAESVLGNVETGEPQGLLQGERFSSVLHHGKHLFTRTASGDWLGYTSA